MRIGMAADHGGFALKEELRASLGEEGYVVVDFGAFRLDERDDYPDFVIPLAKALAAGEVERGIALCTSGVGASIVANKVAGVRAALIHDEFSASQGVEDDDLNVICLGSRVVDVSQARRLVGLFLTARFSAAERHRRRLAKVSQLENAIRQEETHDER
ncbi:ribose-5-phosphate isomerase [Geomonas limicola]|uniref:Ribose-5-phosphate isomerase n=1 Tax=Geomonas limicola TaxID=2740186 RepID=A0A6V8NHC9_9BACT|nr:RpiB/LacA/LacB family sugar-phosphate isomerase [Geomonas limicola]GFO70329.1 ribose-5-phosphate isomerase [Geomonas limicola]